uniref:Uncharacterized protein n=1 Tax=Trichuris muris TaxID=70415 RepID=A0A5S6QED5_TRIMR
MDRRPIVSARWDRKNAGGGGYRWSLVLKGDSSNGIDRQPNGKASPRRDVVRLGGSSVAKAELPLGEGSRWMGGENGPSESKRPNSCQLSCARRLCALLWTNYVRRVALRA